MRRKALMALALAASATPVLAQTQYKAEALGEDGVEGFARVDGMLIGGIAGLDYDAQSKRWFTVTDDNGENEPVRFFEMQIDIGDDGSLSVGSNLVQKLNAPDGTIFEPGLHKPSGVRIIPPDPPGDEPYLIWSSEGALENGHKAGVFEMCTGATFMDGFKLAEHNTYIEGKQGPRPDRAFESIALLPNMDVISGYAEALQQDGPPAMSGSGTTYARLVRLDYKSADPISELAYPLEEPPASAPEGARRSLVELVAVDDHTLLAVESIEAPKTGRLRHAITELYLVDLKGATNITSLDSLRGLEPGKDFVPVSKTFIGDNDSMGLPDYPFAAAAFGPMLKDGRALLVLASDNDFDQYRPTFFNTVAIEGLHPKRPFVAPGGHAYVEGFIE